MPHRHISPVKPYRSKLLYECDNLSFDDSITLLCTYCYDTSGDCRDDIFHTIIGLDIAHCLSLLHFSTGNRSG